MNFQPVGVACGLKASSNVRKGLLELMPPLRKNLKLIFRWMTIRITSGENNLLSDLSEKFVFGK